MAWFTVRTERHYLYTVPAERLTISFDKNATTFGKYAFYKSKINALELPEKLETIGDAAFYSSSVEYSEIPGYCQKK